MKRSDAYIVNRESAELVLGDTDEWWLSSSSDVAAAAKKQKPQYYDDENHTKFNDNYYYRYFPLQNTNKNKDYTILFIPYWTRLTYTVVH